MKTLKRQSKNTEGSVLITTVIIVVLLSLIAGTAVRTISNRCSNLANTAAWQEALIAAESGAHRAAAQVDWSLENTSLISGTSVTFTTSEGGEGPSEATVNYTIERVNVPVGVTVVPYYKVTSTGTVALAGSQEITMESADTVLRKLRLKDKTNRVAVRRIQMWLKPVLSNNGPLTTIASLDMNNHNIFVDSFDSADPNRSIDGQPGAIGQFDTGYYPAHVQTTGTVVDVAGAQIYGDLATNGGTAVNSENVKGEIRDDFFQKFAPVTIPTWVSSTPSSGNLNHSTVLTGGVEGSPARYVFNSASLNGQNATLTFTFGTVGNGNSQVVDQDKKYIELFVDGDFNLGGNGSVMIEPGVEVKIYINGSAKFAGNGITNTEGETLGSATTLSIFGISDPAPNHNQGQQFVFDGGSTFVGTVYAPGADLVLAGGGNDATFIGALVGKTAELKGNVEIRWDEQLAKQGVVVRYTVASWAEDTSSF